MTNKIYLDIVQKIKEIISDEHLQPGDKLPSERVLTERLQVGRSSVREALRALELLGLIETRRGEGTFLRDFRDHHLVELLGMFILQDEQAQKDVQQTKFFLEFECIHSLQKRAVNEPLSDEFNELIDKVEKNQMSGNEVMQCLFSFHHNRLLFKIWLVLQDYANKEDESMNEKEKTHWIILLQELLNQNSEKILTEFSAIKNLS
ncbi:FadR/GntR family transcriptional regulator [Bacillus sp. 2205SS5-2]|uniref:FadR/GntR family transcriptional regulator n=1 Tax=Bacillus sp. 2205SS5-2 TaxID=3109031 RepID=UPI003004BB84